MAEQLWKGRFSNAVDSRVNAFTSSIRFDQRLIAQDMKGSGVHAPMLARPGLTPAADCAAILARLASIAAHLAKGFDLPQAVEPAKTYLTGALAAMLDLGQGSGPMDHAWTLQGVFAQEAE